MPTLPHSRPAAPPEGNNGEGVILSPLTEAKAICTTKDGKVRWLQVFQLAATVFVPIVSALVIAMWTWIQAIAAHTEVNATQITENSKSIIEINANRYTVADAKIDHDKVVDAINALRVDVAKLVTAQERGN